MVARDKLSLGIALLLLFLVGSGALVLETTWIRWFRGFMGATAPAVSAGLVALALGQFVGAMLGARLSRRSANPLRAFGALLVMAIIFAFAVRPVLDMTAGVAETTLGRLLSALAATLPASSAIGASFPLLVTAASDSARDLGPRGTAIYAADLFGAALGAGLTVFWLPARFGVSGTYAAGACALGLAAVISYFLSARKASSGRPMPDGSPVRPPTALVLISFASGLGIFATQLLLHQAFGRVLDQSTFAVGAVLTTTLACLAVGTLLVAATQAKIAPRIFVASAGVLASLGFSLFPRLFVGATGGLSYVVGEAYLGRALLLCVASAGLPLVAAACVLPSTFAWSGSESAADQTGAGQLAGRLLAANTVGAIVGALLAPYVLLPTFGLWPSFALLGGIYFAIALSAMPGRRIRAAVVAVVALSVWGGGAWTQPPLRLAKGERLLDTHRSAAGLVAVIERRGELLIQTDNHYALGGTADTVHQERQGHLPLLLHPAPKRVAFIGTATGSSAGVAFEHGVSELVTVEIMPGVTEAATKYFGKWNSNVYVDPRTRVIADDARNFIRQSRETFDVIVADLFVPWRAETGSLYTVSHFERTKARLATGGLFCQWLPLYQLTPRELKSIMATFRSVFSDAEVFRGDFYGEYAIVALCGGHEPLRLDTLSSRTERLRNGPSRDRWVTHPAGPWALHVGALDAIAEELSDAPLNTDDRPFVELASAKNGARHAGRRDWTASGKDWLELSAKMVQPPAAAEDQPINASAGGFALQSASTYWVAGRKNDAYLALHATARLLPDDLFGKAPADPSAADVWPNP